MMNLHRNRCVPAVSSLCLVLAAVALTPARAAQDDRITVLSPLGKPPPITMLAMAPRPENLEGKTVYVVDDGYVGGDRLLKQIVTWFEQNMPEVKAVYRRKAGGFTDHDPKLWAEIEENGAAMIMGMGH